MTSHIRLHLIIKQVILCYCVIFFQCIFIDRNKILAHLIKLKPYISFIFALVVAFGVTVSSIHQHDNRAYDADSEHVLIEDEFICIVCSSVFKFNEVSLSNSEIVNIPDTHVFFTSIEPAITLSGAFKDGRAPPFLS